MKSIKTLVEDIYGLFNTSSPTEVSDELARGFGERLADIIAKRIQPDEKKPTLRVSNLGTPCTRKLWYSINEPDKREPLSPEARIKFLFGDILECLLLFLARLAGHRVEGEQDRVSINGVIGHRDAVVDGVLIDVKSASSYSFDKFKDHLSKATDNFGYLTQLGSYLFASKDDPLIEEKNVAAFLVIDKQLGKICLDKHAFKDVDYVKKVEDTRKLLAAENPPDRFYDDIPDGKSGNRKLGTECSYCDFKWHCHPGLRKFVYANKPVYLTNVKREPRVPEVDIEGNFIARNVAEERTTSTDGYNF